MRDVLKRRAQEGMWAGGRLPVWLVQDRETKRFEVVERVASIVRLMVELRLQGLTETAIAAAMNEEGLTREGNRWRQATVSKYLTERYIEKMEGHQHYRGVGKLPVAEGATWPAILSPEKAREIKRVLASAGKRPCPRRDEDQGARVRTRAAGGNSSYLITGMAFCAVCGAPVRGGSGSQNTTKRVRDAKYSCTVARVVGQKHPGSQAYFSRLHVEAAMKAALSTWLVSPPETPSGGVPPPTVGSVEDRVRLRQLVHLLVARVELPVYVEGVAWGNRGRPRPHVRVVLRYPTADGARVLLSPVCYDEYRGPRRVIGE